MPRRSKTNKSDMGNINTRFNHEITGIFIIAIGLLLLVAMHSNEAGRIGDWIRSILLGLFSSTAIILPYITIFCGIMILVNESLWKGTKSILFFGILFLCVLIFKSLNDIEFIEGLSGTTLNEARQIIVESIKNGSGGGLIGLLITYILTNFFGRVGTYIIISSISLIAIIVYTKISLLESIIKINELLMKLFYYIKKTTLHLKSITSIKSESMNGEELLNEAAITANNINEKDPKIKILDFAIKEKERDLQQIMKNTSSSQTDEQDLTNLRLEKYLDGDDIKYSLPNIDLLNQLDFMPDKNDKKKIIHKAKVLEETLKNFGVQAKVIQVSKGPTITRYELQPSAGVKVSRIVNLSDDIALNLAAPAIRIEAPIPGKSAIGIEIPNEDVATVTLREVIDSNHYQSSSTHLPFALGKDISGSPVVADLCKMPHLLIAGATGSGKSVCVNTLILSLLYKSTPDEVRLLLIDPKVVELNQYNGIPHLLIPVVTDPKKATNALNWAVKEMTQRYQLFAENGVRDISGYNQKFQENKLPYIVVIIDELADLMMVAANDVEDAICRLAQMARAAGIHLIIATQRPSVDVITGVIKANIPSRIAFSVASQADSRTILDMGGAEKLLGKGDMLFYPIGASKPIRIQGCFVSEKEVERVVTFIKNQVENIDYQSEIIEHLNKSQKNAIEDSDELFDEALKIVIETQQASISMLQRKLRIGYNRAARIIDQLEARGIIGPHEGSKPRQVIVDKNYFNQQTDAETH